MNRLRVVTLSALILALVAGGLPVTQSLAGWSRGAAVSARKKKGKHRRRSRAWWRRHRARVRARRERAERRRRLQRAAAWRTANPGLPAQSPAAPVSFRSVNSNLRQGAAPDLRTTAASRPALLPFEFTLPHNWVSPRRTANGETTFTVRGDDGRAAGTAVVAPVSLQRETAPQSRRAKSIGGMSVASLRRTVIDRMVAAGGWVTNDFVREADGRRVFVVVAQTGAPGAPAQSLTFYFTEVNGRVYSLATSVPVEFAAPVAAGSEQFMASLRPSGARNLATQK
jgi:hypothetical protein